MTIPTEIKYPIVDGIYKHYKGGLYRVLTLATHSSSEESMVVFKSLLFGGVYVRPLKEWFETVTSFSEFGGQSRVNRYERVR